jgi:hemerythrin-like domain-containing protein
MNYNPQKRHKALQPLSREHHHGLLLSWKIRSGLSKNVDSKRIKIYANWFFKTHLLPHFDMEETYVFTILPQDHDLIKRAFKDHSDLKQLFANNLDNAKTLRDFEETLEKHIRFEERILFPEIQKFATEEQLNLIEKIHTDDGFEDKLDDAFWE